jgi:hypothetical protein
MPLVILHHLLNVSVQLANKRGLKNYETNKPLLGNGKTGNNNTFGESVLSVSSSCRASSGRLTDPSSRLGGCPNSKSMQMSNSNNRSSHGPQGGGGGCLTPTCAGRLTVGRNETFTLTLSQLKFLL